MLLTLSVFAYVLQSLAGNVTQGGNCSIVNNRLNALTHAFMTDCDAQTFCSSTLRKCTPKGCRRDVWPFGYPDGVAIPPLCSAGSYCPDEEDACKPLVSVGGPCQMNRDGELRSVSRSDFPMSPTADECAPATNYTSFAGLQNFKGSICLRSTCLYDVLFSIQTRVVLHIFSYTNATFGQTCFIDAAVYLGTGPNGERLSSNVTRDNCVTGCYCDLNSTTCQETKSIGASCAIDSECQTVRTMLLMYAQILLVYNRKIVGHRTSALLLPENLFRYQHGNMF